MQGRGRRDRGLAGHQELADFVVGSGTTGAMAAQTLLEGGATVTMLDVGRVDTTYRDLIPDADFVTNPTRRS